MAADGDSPGVGDILLAAYLAPPRLAWSSSCAAQSSDVTAGETVTSGGGYPAPGSSGLSPGLLPMGRLHSLLCHSERLPAHVDPQHGLGLHLDTSQVSPSRSGTARGQGRELWLNPNLLCVLGQVTLSCWVSTPLLKYRSVWCPSGERVGGVPQSRWPWVCGRERTPSVVWIIPTRPYSPALMAPTR